MAAVKLKKASWNQRERLLISIAVGLVVLASAYLLVRTYAGQPTFFDNFSSYQDGLITSEYTYWNKNSQAAKPSANWEMTSGALFAQGQQGYSGTPTYVPGDAVPNPTTTANNNSAIFRLTTKRADYGNAKVGFRLLVKKQVTTSGTGAVAWDGVHIFLRYQSEYNLYYASVNRRDGEVVVKKKCVGGTENGGTYYVLGNTVGGKPIPFNTWQDVASSAETNADGSVTIKLYRENQVLITATDKGVGCAAITNPGKTGIRGDNTEFYFDNFTVEPIGAGNTTSPPDTSAPSGDTNNGDPNSGSSGPSPNANSGNGSATGNMAASANQPIKSSFAGKCLDNNRKRLANGNKIQLYRCNDTTAQKWTIWDDGSIHVNNTAYCLDVKGSGTTPQTIVQLYQCNGTAAQVWKIDYAKHAIVNPRSGLCLDDKYSNQADGTQIWLWQCNGSDAQKWYPPQTTGSSPDPSTNPAIVAIASGISGKCLDNRGNIRANENKIELWDCNSTAAQGWSIRADGTIHFANTNFCLDARAAGTNPETVVQLYQCNGTVAQVWKVNTEANTITNPNSGLCLDDHWASPDNGTQIQLYTCNGTVAQKWVVQSSAVVNVPAPTPTPAPTPSPTPAPTPTPTGVAAGLPGYGKLIFNDEFNGTKVDTAKWQGCNASFKTNWSDPKKNGPNYCMTPYNGEIQWFCMTTNPSCQDAANPNMAVNGGALHLRATKQNGNVYSAMVSTGPNTGGYNLPGYKPFAFTYGYFEARAKMPGYGRGYWPSFWMLPEDQAGHGGWPNGGEYDIVEVLGKDPNRVYFTRFDQERPGGDNSNFAVADTSGWHTYGFQWEPGTLKWYFDGKLYKTVNSGAVKNYPFYITANFSLGGPNSPFPGPIDNSTPFPAEFTVDYMRVFQK